MIIKAKTISQFNSDFINKNEELIIQNSFIDLLDFSNVEFKYNVKICQCIIGELKLNATWFIEGFELVNCIIQNQIQFEMGGHNKHPITIENNIFMNLFVFFDCWFMSDIYVNHNVFLKGCTLKNSYNTFDSVLDCFGNIGDMGVMRMD